MLPEILENIIKWNDIAQVPSNDSSMELYKNLITEEYTEFVTALEKNKLIKNKEMINARYNQQPSLLYFLDKTTRC